MEAVGRNEKVLRGRTALRGPLNGVTVHTGAPLCSFGSQNQTPPVRVTLPLRPFRFCVCSQRAWRRRALGVADSDQFNQFPTGYNMNYSLH